MHKLNLTFKPANSFALFASKCSISRRGFAAGGKKEVIIAGVQPTPITKRKMKLKLIVPAG